MNKILFINTLKTIAVAGIAIIPSFLHAQETFNGSVIDAETGEPLIGATVFLKSENTGAATQADGSFAIPVKQSPPFELQVSALGYSPQDLTVTEFPTKRPFKVALRQEPLSLNDVVVTASRVSERELSSPVSVQKMDLRAIRETAAPSYYDALENVKGIQMTTLSLGFKVPNTRGFTNTTSARFLQLVDGADNQAPGLGVSIAGTASPSELDIQNVELLPGASSALYGMNSLNGIVNLLTKSPFTHKGFSLYQRVGVNHIDGGDHAPAVLSETSLRYAYAFRDRLAFKVNATYMRGTDWLANDTKDLNPLANQSTGLLGADNPALDPINSYGNESSNRRSLTMADGKIYEVRRTGYYETDLINNDYKVENLKFDAALHYRFLNKYEASYTYRFGQSDAIYQRGNRIRLDDYRIQQHKVELKSDRLLLRWYMTTENTGKSYNVRPMGENIDRAFKTDNDWFAEYRTAYNAAFNAGQSAADAHRAARATADQGRYTPGTEAFDAKLTELAGINNWDIGAWLKMDNRFWHLEGQYDFSGLLKWVDIQVGADFRRYVIVPDGNSFVNLEEEGKDLFYDKTGGFVQLSKGFFSDKLKIYASLRADKNNYFDLKFNQRVAAVLNLDNKHVIRASYQNGYRFPTLFEGFSYVNNGGVLRVGGLPLMSLDKQIFENSYTRASVDAFSNGITTDRNQNGLTLEQAILNNQNKLVRNTYTYIQPEHVNAFELGYKALPLGNKITIDAEVYFSIFDNFMEQIELAVPNEGTIGTIENGVDSTIFEVADRTRHKRYRMFTNSKSTTYSLGSSVSASWNFWKEFVFSANGSYNEFLRSEGNDALEAAFNTPRWIVNATLGNRNVYHNLGFSVTWRWQSGFDWRAPLANGYVPAYHTLDAQVSLFVPVIKTHFKLGASNLLNQYYTQYTGGPRMGGIYYLSLRSEF